MAKQTHPRPLDRLIQPQVKATLRSKSADSVYNRRPGPRRQRRTRKAQANAPICKRIHKLDALKQSETGETERAKRTVVCHVAQAHRLRGRLPETAETCVVRLIAQRQQKVR